MFHRRHRSTSASRQAQANNVPASSPAQSAATLAFLAHRGSQPNLSASAAAAALRTLSPTPTPVGQVQTKRMLQRQSSVSSNGSSHASRPTALQRTNSTGSMTERTFRGPSPNRASSSAARTRPPGVPPVPAVPRSYMQQPAAQRPASVEPPPPRVMSPPPKKPLGRGMSVDRGAMGSTKKAPPKRMELERSDSRNSINFSYPMSARPTSPPTKPAVKPSPSKPAAEVRKNAGTGKAQQKGLSSAETDEIQYSLAHTASQPVKKKKKKVVRGAAEGSHLASGGMGAKPMVTPLAPAPVSEEPSAPNNEPISQPAKKKKKKKVAPSGEASQLGDRSLSPSLASDAESNPDKESERRAQRAAGALAKHPSVVREDWEGEQGQGDPSISPAQSPSSAVQGKKPSSAANVSRKIDENTTHLRSASQQNQALGAEPSDSTKANSSQGYLQVADGGSPGQRTVSLSPSRSTRFALLSSDISSQGKHEPPARSISPAKSALKHHSLGSSLMEHHMPGGWRRSSQTPSEASDNTSMASMDGPTPISKKKKSARVSFDAEPKILTSPADAEHYDGAAGANSQQKDSTKKSWFGNKSKGPALGTIPADDEMEEVMKPRPALPSFGSVRNKGRESPEEIAAAYSRMTSPSSSEASSVSNIPTVDTSVSSDHALGGLVAQDFAKPSSREGKFGQKARFAEGTDTSDTDGSVFNAQPVKKNALHLSEAKAVPAIAVLPATPGLESSEAPDQWSVRLPGQFPGQFPDASETKQRATEHVPGSTPKGLGIADPKAQATTTPVSPSSALHPESEEESSDDDSSAGNSVYSDAAEDMADADGLGFGSINAIVESPIAGARETRLASPPESPTTRLQGKLQDAEPKTSPREGSWDETQAHWSGVAERYRQVSPQSSQPAADSPEPVASKAAPAQSSKSMRNAKNASPPTSFPTSFRSDSPARESGSDTNGRPVSQSSAYPPIGVARTSSRSHGSMRQSMRNQAQPPPEVETGSHFRHSMRAQPPAQPEVETGSHFRQSMRSQPQPQPQPEVDTGSHFRQSMRAGGGQPSDMHPSGNNSRMAQPRSSLKKKNSTTAPSAAVTAAAALATTNGVRPKPSPPAVPPRAKPAEPSKALQRTFSNGSESDSSFRRQRRPSKSSDGRYSMKRSLRASASVDEPTRRTRSGTRDARSVSPVNRRQVSPGPPTAMRSTMRSADDSSVPSLRTPSNHQRATSAMSGLSKPKMNGKAPPSAPRLSKPITSILKTHSADSDDERTPAPPKVFRSRFEDSSDEEPEPVNLRPVRGIPRKANDGDSTDLDDSSEDDAPAQKPRKVSSTKQPPRISTESNGNVQNGKGDRKGSGAEDSPASPSAERKRSFFGRLLGKKAKTDDSKTTSPVSPIPETANGVAEGNHVTSMDTEPDVPNGPEGAPPTMQKGKLHRRSMPDRVMSDSWPLPLKIEPTIPEEERPNTSAGVMTETQPTIQGTDVRPALAARTDTPSSFVRGGEKGKGNAAVGKGGKKKRFPKLRKAFGLTD